MWFSDFDFSLQFVSLERKCLVFHQLLVSIAFSIIVFTKFFKDVFFFIQILLLKHDITIILFLFQWEKDIINSQFQSTTNAVIKFLKYLKNFKA